MDFWTSIEYKDDKPSHKILWKIDEQGNAKLADALRNYTFLDDGMDAETRPQVRAEAEKALEQYEATK